MIYKSLLYDSYRFKSTMRMTWESRYGVTMIHVPAIFALEILTYISTTKGCIGTHVWFSIWKVVLMIRAKYKWILSLPWKAQWTDCLNGGITHFKYDLGCFEDQPIPNMNSSVQLAFNFRDNWTIYSPHFLPKKDLMLLLSNHELFFL